MKKAPVRALATPAEICQAATTGDGIGWCTRDSCIYGRVHPSHIDIRGNRALLTIRCGRCHAETVIPWLTCEGDRWTDPNGQPAPVHPNRITIQTLLHARKAPTSM